MKKEAYAYLIKIVEKRADMGYSLCDREIGNIACIIQAIKMDLLQPELVFKMRLDNFGDC